MKLSNTTLKILAGNFFLVGFLMSAIVLYWAINVETAGAGVNYSQVIPLAVTVTLIITALRTWLIVNLNDGHY